MLGTAAQGGTEQAREERYVQSVPEARAGRAVCMLGGFPLRRAHGHGRGFAELLRSGVKIDTVLTRTGHLHWSRVTTLQQY